MSGTIQSIERAAAALRLLSAGSRGLTLLEVSAALGLAKGTTHGILRTLVDIGFVGQDPATGRYDVGDRLASLGTATLDAHTVRSVALNWADTLAARAGEQVLLGVLRGPQVEVVHHVFRPDDSEQQMRTGAMLPAHASAMGKALLAYHPAAQAQVLAGHQVLHTHRTVTDPQVVLQHLAAVRRDGSATEVEELVLGQASVAAPVRGRGGLVVAAVEVSGDVERLCDGRGQVRTRFVTQVRTVARAMSKEFAA
ncbi:IclR family transcriptional regulator [Aquipuribacter sp. MA13-6]|uniref:IclR family transcriptional regulator n=1 Tax=unclassified Aquipuribacter TaxID=2635084 RepID=UPI003EEEB36A